MSEETQTPEDKFALFIEKLSAGSEWQKHMADQFASLKTRVHRAKNLARHIFGDGLVTDRTVLFSLGELDRIYAAGAKEMRYLADRKEQDDARAAEAAKRKAEWEALPQEERESNNTVLPKMRVRKPVQS